MHSESDDSQLVGKVNQLRKDIDSALKNIATVDQMILTAKTKASEGKQGIERYQHIMSKLIRLKRSLIRRSCKR